VAVAEALSANKSGPAGIGHFGGHAPRFGGNGSTLAWGSRG